MWSTCPSRRTQKQPVTRVAYALQNYDGVVVLPWQCAPHFDSCISMPALCCRTANPPHTNTMLPGNLNLLNPDGVIVLTGLI